MATLDIHQFFVIEDNFGVLVHDKASGATASIDAADADAVTAQLQSKGWKLTDIFTTHHHTDHVAGNLALKAATGARITGPAGERDKIPGIDRAVGGGDHFDFAGHRVDVIDTPGHTAGHISYYLPADATVFVGDTLFSLGCGRLFEGDATMMWASLQRLMALPPATAVYCGHEYTQSNANFALKHDPDNPALVARAKEVAALRAAGRPTLPTTIGAELASNPFLRAGDPAIRRRLDLANAADWEVFGALRELKNKG